LSSTSTITSTTKSDCPLCSSSALSVLRHANAATAELGKMTAAHLPSRQLSLPPERCLSAAVILLNGEHLPQEQKNRKGKMGILIPTAMLCVYKTWKYAVVFKPQCTFYFRS